MRGVTVCFGSTVALNSVDLDVRPGAIYCLLGRNGAGKTTALRLIAGLGLPTRGDVRIDGTCVRSPEIHRVRRTLGYVPQDPVLYEQLTGKEFLDFIQELYGVGSEARGAIDLKLSPMDLGTAVDAPIRTYSAGMRRKIALLAALLVDPSFLVLDEPFTSLDLAGTEVLESEMRSLRDRGGLVLVATHDLDLAEKLADRIGILDRGKRLFEGTLEALRSSGEAGVPESLSGRLRSVTSA